MSEFEPRQFDGAPPHSSNAQFDSKEWRFNILQEADDTFDTFDTLSFATVDEYLRALKTIQPLVHGFVIAGRRAHATPGAGMEWGRSLGFCNGAYALQVRCAPKGLFAQLQQVARKLCKDDESGEVSEPKAYFSYGGRGLHLRTSELAKDLQPCVLMHSLKHTAASTSSTTSMDKVVTTTILMPQCNYNTKDDSRSKRLLADRGFCGSVIPWCILSVISSHRALTVGHLALIEKHTNELVLKRTSFASDAVVTDLKDVKNLPKEVESDAQLATGPGYRVLNTSPTRELRQNGHTLTINMYAYDIVALLISGKPLTQEPTMGIPTATYTSSTSHPFRVASTPSGITSSKRKPRQTSERAANTLERHINHTLNALVQSSDPSIRKPSTQQVLNIASWATEDLLHCISISSFLAWRVCPATRDALPDYMVRPLEYPFIIAATLRMAARPDLFRIRDAHLTSIDTEPRSFNQEMACLEFNRMVESVWPCVEDKKGIMVPTLLDLCIYECMEMASRMPAQTHTRSLGSISGNRQVREGVMIRCMKWSHDALRSITELFSPSSYRHNANLSAVDTLMSGRLKSFRQQADGDTFRTNTQHYWPLSACSITELREEMINLVNGVEQTLRDEMAIKERAQRFVNHYMEVNRLMIQQEDEEVADDEDNSSSEEQTSSPKPAARPPKDMMRKMVLVQPRGEEGRMNDHYLPSTKNDIFARDQFGDEYDSAYDIFRGSQESQQTETLANANRALKEAMANGSVHAFEYMSVRFGLFTPMIEGECVNCGKPMPSFEECVPMPHGRCIDCHKHICWECIGKRAHASAYECKTCVEQHTQYQGVGTN